ncbi:MAG: aldolase class II-like protein [Parcubacteria group bacterium Licking1014_17]|nr:MAG: aldolase class II-like protein [Parcubacteria group bacterium Licking1014_17]
MVKMQHFLRISKYIGSLPDLVQGPGGNVSIKTNGHIVIKASGFCLRDIRKNYGYIKVKNSPDMIVVANGDSSTPSIETFLHVLIDSKYVIHAHSVSINVFSCMKNGEQELRKIIKLPFLFLRFRRPGADIGRELKKAIRKNKTLPSVIVLQNHGLITHHNSAQKALDLMMITDLYAKKYLEKNGIVPFKVLKERCDVNNHLFPDSVVFFTKNKMDIALERKELFFELYSAHNYILDSISKLGKTPNFLSASEVKKIRNMRQEKYRKNKYAILK